MARRSAGLKASGRRRRCCRKIGLEICCGVVMIPGAAASLSGGLLLSGPFHQKFCGSRTWRKKFSLTSTFLNQNDLTSRQLDYN